MKRCLLALTILAGCGDSKAALTADAGTSPAWLHGAVIAVPGVGSTESDCRTKVCGHNENTDLTRFDGAVYFVHRTAESQVLGPNSSLRVYRSDDEGATFALLAIIPAPLAADDPDLGDRDLRDPSFYVIDGNLALKAITRLPVNSTRDSDVDSITVGTVSSDGGHTWSPLAPIGPATWSFWRVRDDQHGTHYSAAYEDGDRSVKLFSSANGVDWTAGATIYDVAADTPLETELVFMPSGRLLALVRMDGTDDELLGNIGRLRTAVCWATPPYASFDCPQVLDGVRLDGPVAFFAHERLFVVARKHFIDPSDKKRTALYELGGTLEGGPLTIKEWGEFPSAGDTSYAGAVALEGTADDFLITWYSSDLDADEPWARAIFEASDIWKATLAVDELPAN